jgi:hypothetical protein
LHAVAALAVERVWHAQYGALVACEWADECILMQAHPVVLLNQHIAVRMHHSFRYAISKVEIAGNLKQLGVASVNLTLLHSLDCIGAASVAETWRALEDAKRSGLTTSIGVCACTCVCLCVCVCV